MSHGTCSVCYKPMGNSWHATDDGKFVHKKCEKMLPPPKTPTYPCGCDTMEHITVESEWGRVGRNFWYCYLFCHLHKKTWEVKYEKI